MFRSKFAIIFNGILKISSFLAGCLVIFLMLSVSLDVALRYFVGKPMSWVSDLCSYALVYIPFLAAAWILKDNGHARMDFVINNLNRKNRYFMNIVTSFAGATVCFILVCFGGKITFYLYEKGYHMAASTLKIPQFSIIAVIVFGSFLLFVQFLREGYGHIEKWKALRKGGQECKDEASAD